jgi:hypothetical protein
MQDAPNQIHGNDWVRHGLAPMTTTHIVRSCYEKLVECPYVATGFQVSFFIAHIKFANKEN